MRHIVTFYNVVEQAFSTSFKDVYRKNIKETITVTLWGTSVIGYNRSGFLRVLVYRYEVESFSLPVFLPTNYLLSRLREPP